MNDTTKTILTLAAGAVAGAVTALLLAPNSGSDTRRVISRTVGKVKDDLTSTIHNAMGKGESLVETTGPDLGRRQTTAAGTTGAAGATGTTGAGNTSNRINSKGRKRKLFCILKAGQNVSIERTIKLTKQGTVAKCIA